MRTELSQKTMEDRDAAVVEIINAAKTIAVNAAGADTAYVAAAAAFFSAPVVGYALGVGTTYFTDPAK